MSLKINDKAILDRDTKKVIPFSTYGDEKALLEWATWMEKADRHVAKTKINKQVEVSTIFLALNHGFGEKDLWFETMVFGGVMDGHQDRYETWDEAMAGHLEMVERVTKGKEDILNNV